MKSSKIKIMGIALSMLLTIGTATSFGESSPSFSDMPPVGNYARAGLELGVKNGLITGYDGKIMPNGNVTRAQMAAIMNKVFGATEQADLTAFNDVDAKAWYYNDMAKAVYLKLFLGSGDKLSPMNNITREQVCVVLANAFNLTASDLTALDRFSDKAKVDSWAKEGVAAMVNAGYINGNQGQLKPLDFITRAELLTIMSNMVQTYLNTPGEYTGTFEGNVMINSPGVTFKDATIKGNLYIGDGFGSNELSLDGLIVAGRIVVKGSALITELELIEEEIALGGAGQTPVVPVTPTTPGTPTNPGTPTTPDTPTPPPVSENNAKLISVNAKLSTRVVPLLSTDTQVEAVTLIMDSISKYIADASYDITTDVATAKVLGAQMTAEEYAYFKNAITGNIPISELVALNNYFKVIEY